MKNLKFNDNIEKIMSNIKRGIALISAIFCVGTITTGCTNDGWKSGDYDTVNNEVHNIVDSQNDQIRFIFMNNFTFIEAKEELVKRGINLSDSEIYYYLDMYKNANSKNDSDLVKQKLLEASILAEQERNNRK